MAEREILFHNMGNRIEIFIYRNLDGTLTLRTENEGVRVLKHGVNPVETVVTVDELRERFGKGSIWSKIEAAIG